MKTIDAKEIIGEEIDPSTDGRKLGTAIALGCAEDCTFAIDVRGLAPEDLVSSFVNAMLLAMTEHGIAIKATSAITWQTRFPSEEKRLATLTQMYVEDHSTRTPSHPAVG